jgi:hypothetical protein
MKPSQLARYIGEVVLDERLSHERRGIFVRLALDNQRLERRIARLQEGRVTLSSEVEKEEEVSKILDEHVSKTFPSPPPPPLPAQFVVRTERTEAPLASEEGIEVRPFPIEICPDPRVPPDEARVRSQSGKFVGTIRPLPEEAFELPRDGRYRDDCNFPSVGGAFDPERRWNGPERTEFVDARARLKELIEKRPTVELCTVFRCRPQELMGWANGTRNLPRALLQTIHDVWAVG